MKKVLYLLVCFMGFSFVILAQVKKEGMLMGLAGGFSQMIGSGFNNSAFNNFKNSGGMIDFYLGSSLNSDLALMGYFNGHFGTDENFTNARLTGANFSHYFIGPAIHYNASSLFFLRFATGATFTDVKKDSTLDSLDFTVSAKRTGFGALAGMGVDILQKNDSALDMHVKVQPQWFKGDKGGFDIGWSMGAGYTWY